MLCKFVLLSTKLNKAVASLLQSDLSWAKAKLFFAIIISWTNEPICAKFSPKWCKFFLPYTKPGKAVASLLHSDLSWTQVYSVDTLFAISLEPIARFAPNFHQCDANFFCYQLNLTKPSRPSFIAISPERRQNSFCYISWTNCPICAKFSPMWCKFFLL